MSNSFRLFCFANSYCRCFGSYFYFFIFRQTALEVFLCNFNIFIALYNFLQKKLNIQFHQFYYLFIQQSPSQFMDQLFGNSPPKKKQKKPNNQKNYNNQKPKPKKEGIDEQKNEEKQKTNGQVQIQKNQQGEKTAQQQCKQRQRRDRNKNKKNEQIKKIQQKKKKVNQQLELPFVIKMHRSLMGGNDNTQMSLDDFIEFIYSDKKSADMPHRNKIVKQYEEENDQGNIQYKLKLIKPSEDRLDHLATQMKFRIGQGYGQAYYKIGVEDDGIALGLAQQQMYESLKTICTIANKIHASITAVAIADGIKGNIVQLMVTKNQKQGVKLEIRLLLMGEPGSGKSTLLGAIKSGQLDNGKGYSRTKVFTHKDQFMSGITQTKSHHIIAFDSKGKLFNNTAMMSIQTWLQNSSKILSFIDVGGHKQKQVVSSLCSFFPQYALWVVSGANKAPSTSCIELAKSFNLPLIVVITHMDLLDQQNQMDKVMKIKKTIKQFYPESTSSVIKDMDGAVLYSRITSTMQVIPIFVISSVTGKNLDLLTNFFNLLTSTNQLKHNEDLHAEFLISNKFSLEKNIILAGTVIKGTIKKGQILHLGPDSKGTFRAIQVLSIQCMRVPVKLAMCGQICTIAIKLLSYAREWLQKEPNAIRRGMVLIQSKNNPKATHQFTASFMPYSSSCQQVKITGKYQPVINTQTIRQICDIILMDNNDIGQLDLGDTLVMKKKKSRSIDIFEPKSKSASHISHSSAKLYLKKNATTVQDKIEQEKLKMLPKKKQSEDYTSQPAKLLKVEEPKSPLSPLVPSPLSKKKMGELQPIQQTKQEGKLKKKKIDRDIEIKFTNNQPTQLRLRFKYYPQYLEHGQKLVINQLKLIGRVTQLHY